MSVTVRLLAPLAAVALCSAASAGKPGDSQPCPSIADATERLACYDRLHRPVAPATTPATAPPVPGPTRDTQPPAVPDGLGAEQVPKPPDDAAADRAAELVATVTGMGEQVTGRHWFRLENGQLWSQVSPGRPTVDVGDSVRISRGSLNTYSLRRADGSSRSTAVRRLE